MKKKYFLMIVAFVCVATLIAPPYLYVQGAQSSKKFKAEELDQMVAPVALYPDQLLSQVLMASTYPLEVVQAARWVKENTKLKGDQLEAALKKKNWDTSVKSLIPFPEVLAMMSEQLEWTQKLGDAFLAQQKDVMAAVQRLRIKAEAAGNLKTTREQTVIVEKTADTKIIKIEPATQVVYVPAYNPTVVYGVWAYPSYPPVVAYPPGYVATTALVSFGVGVAVGAAMYGGCNWGHGDIYVNNYYNGNRPYTPPPPPPPPPPGPHPGPQPPPPPHGGSTPQPGTHPPAGTGTSAWQHDPEHRKGVAYRDQATAQQYNRASSAQNIQSREAYRGKTARAPENISTQPAGTGARQGTMNSGKQGKSAMESGEKHNAFGGMDKGSNAKMQSDRGQTSRQSMFAAQPSGKGGSGIRSGGGRRR